MVEPKAFQDALLAYHARPCDAEAEAVRASVLLAAGMGLTAAAPSRVELWDAIAELVVACGGSAAHFDEEIADRIDSAARGVMVFSTSDVGGKNDHAEALRGLRSVKVLLGTDAPEVRGWAPAVRQAAQKSINTAIRVLSAGARVLPEGSATWAPESGPDGKRSPQKAQADAILGAAGVPGGCECAACRVTPHASDCAVHNAPALPIGPCDCGAAGVRVGGVSEETQRWAIDVEKRLCGLLGQSWTPSGISVLSLIDAIELRLLRAAGVGVLGEPQQEKELGACSISRAAIGDRTHDREAEDRNRSAGRQEQGSENPGRGDAIRPGSAESGARGGNAAQHEVATDGSTGNGAALLQRIEQIAGDFVPSNDREAPLALQEMRDALMALVTSGVLGTVKEQP